MWLLMNIREHYPLQSLNTFGIAAEARYFAEPKSDSELHELLVWRRQNNLPLLVLGGGSNLVFVGDFPGLVLKPSLCGIRVLEENSDSVLVEAGAGEVWHDFVQYTLTQGWFGLENLSLIPGTVGAAPVQNIGAYGVELADRLESLEAVDIATGRVHEYLVNECRFAYRDSLFKQEESGRKIITRVCFRLSKKADLKIAYGDIRQELEANNIIEPTAKQVAEAVIAIRQRKLPDPKIIGNVGSFFKNPVVSQSHYEQLKRDYPQMVSYPQLEGVKLAAGWLIDQSGWKGKRVGAVGTYDKQALVLVNHGGASGTDVLHVAEQIQQDVLKKFGVALEMEPSVVGVSSSL